LQVRCCSGKVAEARKVFAYIAAREYQAPLRMIADFCHAGIAAVPAMAKAGQDNARKRHIVI
jgi:hypothetical protein